MMAISNHFNGSETIRFSIIQVPEVLANVPIRRGLTAPDTSLRLYSQFG